MPPREAALAATPAALAGQGLFEKIGCNTCHVESITTAPTRTMVNGGTFSVPDALGNKILHPFSDFLLHDIETVDGIVQVGPQDTANKFDRHEGEAEHVTRRFRKLGPAEKQRLFAFLNSL
jgi:CxxC motif-containing protein (DUF1111 family)